MSTKVGDTGSTKKRGLKKEREVATVKTSQVSQKGTSHVRDSITQDRTECNGKHYRAVDSERNTLEFLLSQTRDAEVARRFFIKALPSTACTASQVSVIDEYVAQPFWVQTHQAPKATPRVINVDKTPPIPKRLLISKLLYSGVAVIYK